jgi:hypothetical protein
MGRTAATVGLCFGWRKGDTGGKEKVSEGGGDRQYPRGMGPLDREKGKGVSG